MLAGGFRRVRNMKIEREDVAEKSLGEGNVQVRSSEGERKNGRARLVYIRKKHAGGAALV